MNNFVQANCSCFKLGYINVLLSVQLDFAKIQITQVRISFSTSNRIRGIVRVMIFIRQRIQTYLHLLDEWFLLLQWR
jgi:hypothetical protein